jgi:tRNA U34 5-carboxymethylaminomethyl modifying GTPase MnmE/TrmE
MKVNNTFVLRLLIILLCQKLSFTTTANGLLLLMGPTRAGKSCFINTITARNLTIVGDDAGDSTTKTNELYTSKIDGFDMKKDFNLVDTMGLNDSEESEFADNIIFANTLVFIKNIMKSNNRSLDSILIFESLTNDSNQLGKTIKKLIVIFGEQVSRNSIVVLNKNPRPNEKRIKRLISIADNYKMKYLNWKSGCGYDAIHDTYYDQMSFLENTIKNNKPFTLIELENIFNKLREEGKKIFDNKGIAKVRLVKALGSIGTLGMFAFSALNLPAVVISNIAVWSADQIWEYFNKNENINLIISLAIEARIRETFKRDEL